MRKSIINTELTIEDKNNESVIRPQFFDEYVGQKTIDQLKIYIQAAKKKRAIGSCTILWSSGLGKTTLANIIANELDVNLKVTSGPAIERPGEIAAIFKWITRK